MSNLQERIYNHVLELLPQIEREQDRDTAVLAYINDLTNWELIQLISNTQHPTEGTRQ